MHEQAIEKIMQAKGPVYVRCGFARNGAEWQETRKENLVAFIKDGYYAHYTICSVNGSFGINFYSTKDLL